MSNANVLCDLTDPHFSEFVEYCRQKGLISKETAKKLTYFEQIKQKTRGDHCRSKALLIFPVEGADVLRAINASN